jgi:hypothetical protein
MSDYGDVELSIEKGTGSTSIASQTYRPNINIGNVASNSFTSPEQQTFEFDITEQGDYVIAIYSAAAEWSDCIVGQLILSATSFVDTGIEITNCQQPVANSQYYDLQGRKISVSNPSTLRKGIYIKDGKKFFKLR